MEIIKWLKEKIRARRLARDIARFEKWQKDFKATELAVSESADYKKFCEAVEKLCREIEEECQEGERRLRFLNNAYTADDIIKGGDI